MNKTDCGAMLYVRSQLVATDGRLVRYLSFMKTKQLSYRVFCWDRTASEHSLSDEGTHTDYFTLPAHSGSRYANVLKLIRWNLAVFVYCVKNRNKIGKVQCADFDSVLPCFLFSKLFSRPLVFDSYDRYSDSRVIGYPLKYLVDRLETYIMHKADFAILPSERRITQYQLQSTKNLLIIENVPLFGSSATPGTQDKSEKLNTVMQAVTASRSQIRAVVSYVGILEPKVRGLEHALNCAASMPDLVFIIAGAGPLDSLISRYANEHPNIYFLGALDYALAEQIMSFSDLHLGLYYLSNPNHKYAAPNKYYEHLYFGKPLLTSAHTPPGLLVEQWATGFTIGDTEDELRQFLSALDPLLLKTRGEQARSRWQKYYANYYQETFEKRYREVVSS